MHGIDPTWLDLALESSCMIQTTIKAELRKLHTEADTPADSAKASESTL